MAISPYATAAQQGESYGALRFDSKAATDYLSGAEQAEYSAATRGLGLEPKRGKGGKIKNQSKVQGAHNAATDKIRRLRDVAASRAFGAYTEAGADYSKPWKVQAGPQGLISAEDVSDTMSKTGTKSYGALDVAAGRKMRDTLSSMTSGNEGTILDPKLIGNYQQQKANQFTIGAIGQGSRTMTGRIATGKQTRPSGGGMSGIGGTRGYSRTRSTLSAARTKGDVLDAERVYTGMGGFDLRSRAPDFGY